MHAEEQHACLLREKRPHAVDAPTRLVGMHHQRVGQQRAQHVELVLPVPRQLLQQGVGLRFAQLQVLQELQHQTDFVEGQADDINRSRRSRRRSPGRIRCGRARREFCRIGSWGRDRFGRRPARPGPFPDATPAAYARADNRSGARLRERRPRCALPLERPCRRW